MVVGMPDIVPRSAARRREVDCVGPLVPELRSDPLDRAFFVSLGETSSSTSASEWPDTIEEGPHPHIVINQKRPRGRRRFKWWWEVDSNHRRINPADLQSALVGHLSIPPEERRSSRFHARSSRAFFK